MVAVTINGTTYTVAPKLTVHMLMDIERNHLEPGQNNIASLINGERDPREVTAIFASELTGMSVDAILDLSIGEFAALSELVSPIVKQSFADPIVRDDAGPRPTPKNRQ